MPIASTASRLGRGPAAIRRSLLLLFGAVFLFLLVSRREVLLLPPYWDQLVGLWREAVFLCDSGLDYGALLSLEPAFERMDSSRSYVVTAIPGLMALVFHYVDSPRQAFLLYRLLCFACGAGVVVLVYYCVRRTQSASIALLVALAVLTTPLFAAQVEMLGLDMPLTLLTTAAVVAAYTGRLGWTVGFSAAAIVVKPSGPQFLIATLVFAVLVWLLFRRQRQFRRTWRLDAVLGSCLVLLALELGVLRLIQLGNMQSLAPPWMIPDALRVSMALMWAPDLVLLGATALAACGAVVLSAVVKSPRQWRRALRAAVRTSPGTAYAATVLVVAVGLATLTVFHPRYLLPLVPCIWLMLASLLGRTRWLVPLVACVITVNLINQNGAFLPSIQHRQTLRDYARAGAFLERSREYLPYLLEDIQVTRHLSETYPGVPVMTTLEFGVAMSDPRYGYVKQPSRVYLLLDELSRTRFEPELAKLLRDRPERLIVFAAPGFDVSGILPPEAAVAYNAPLPFPGLIAYDVRYPADEALRVAAYSRLLEFFLSNDGPESGGSRDAIRTFLEHYALGEYGELPSE